mgnify:FL=1|tara:strand:- start:56 stop:310 length:255 start_codon:yes stop_codon:yes gene_type:complete
MDIHEYKEHICEIINRLQNENTVDITYEQNEEKKLIFKLNFNPPSWFKVLDNDVKHCALDNLQRIILKSAKEVIEKYNLEQHSI